MLGLRRRSFPLVAVSVLLIGAPVFAQTPTGRISGTVRDSTGVPREAATVRATNRVTGATRSTTTGPDGAYSIAGIAPGAYTVTASLIGFRRATRSDVQVEGATTVDLVLEPLALQAITVTATLREQEIADVPFSIAAPTASGERELVWGF